MTTSEPRREAPTAPPARDAREASATPSICPYLRAPAGWRSVGPSRDHRCTAVSPAARLSGDKQARLCLADGHRDCPTFVAALEARVARGVPPLVDRRPLARTIPTVIEPARPRLGLGLGVNGRRIGQGGVALLMLVALVAVVLARTAPGGAGQGSAPSPSEPAGSVAVAASTATDTASVTLVPSGSPSTAVTPPPSAATARPTSSPATPAPTPTARPTARPSAAPTPGPSGAYVNYTVKSGDTLSAIAVRYKSSVQAILDANGIKATDYLQIGEVLRIPR